MKTNAEKSKHLKSDFLKKGINIKLTRFFSPALMIEGLKQTKGIGICLTIFMLIISCFSPLFNLMDNFIPNNNSVFAMYVEFTGFAIPIFMPCYIVPIILVSVLFSFMNKRNASDFYHSAPLNKTCVYITYTIVVVLWCVAMVTLSTLLSYILYAIAPHTVINAGFILRTLISSLILALLVMSISLVAKGLSGTGFSNIVITVLLMFAPRILIMLFALSAISAVKIANVDAIPFADIYNNIIFAPLDTNLHSFEDNVNNTSTLWYSFILALVYFVAAYLLHRFRSSEAAGTSSSYRLVQHIVRTMFGFLPTLLICVPLACRETPDFTFSIIAIVASLLLYFLYEFATTRSMRKMLISIPLYLVVIACDIFFVCGSYAISEITLNDIPETADIESVTVSHENLNENQYTTYNNIKLSNCKMTDPELIELLQASLVENVEDVRANEYYPNFYDGHYETYYVTFRCKNGRNISRKVYVDREKFYDRSEINSADNIVEKMMEKDNSYINAVTALPKDTEVERISPYIDALSVYNFSDEECRQIWNSFKSEYSALSYEDKVNILNNSFSASSVGAYIEVEGYTGVKNFYSAYSLSPTETPKTFTMLVELSERRAQENMGSSTDRILSDIKLGKYFSIDIITMKNGVNCEYISYDPDDEGLTVRNETGDLFFETPNPAEKDINSVKRIAEILTNAADKEFDPSAECLLLVQFDFGGNQYYEYTDDDGNVHSELINNQYIVSLTKEECDEVKNIVAGFER